MKSLDKSLIDYEKKSGEYLDSLYIAYHENDMS